MIAESRIYPRVGKNKIQLRRQRLFSNFEHRNSRSFETQFSLTKLMSSSIFITGYVHLVRNQDIEQFEMIAASRVSPSVGE
jgi:hypothetical protein